MSVCDHPTTPFPARAHQRSHQSRRTLSTSHAQHDHKQPCLSAGRPPWRTCGANTQKGGQKGRVKAWREAVERRRKKKRIKECSPRASATKKKVRQGRSCPHHTLHQTPQRNKQTTTNHSTSSSNTSIFTSSFHRPPSGRAHLLVNKIKIKKIKLKHA
jgi:hypothetical protein